MGRRTTGTSSTMEQRHAELQAAQYIRDSALALANLAAVSKFERLAELLRAAAIEAAALAVEAVGAQSAP